MAIVTGQIVRGTNFYGREYLLEDMFEAINSGSNLLLVAPRRVGKTSLMYRVFDTIGDDYVVVYINTEAQRSVNSFWEKVFTELLNEEFISSLKNKTSNFFKQINLTEISLKGVKFGENNSIDYAKEFTTLLKSYDGEKKLIIMLDEFSQTIENIIQDKNETDAEHLLQLHRQLSQNQDIASKVVFIYAGSIGLEGVVGNIHASKHINDLTSIQVPPFESEEALEFTKHLCITNSIDISDEVIEYLLLKIEWLIPYYIQIIIQEVKRLVRKNPNIDKNSIDEAINKILLNQHYFIHWQERLKTFSTEGNIFAKEVLNHISKKSTIGVRKISNLGEKYKLDEGIKIKIINALVYDGYINISDDKKVYRFNSPLLKLWWFDNVAN